MIYNILYVFSIQNLLYIPQTDVVWKTHTPPPYEQFWCSPKVKMRLNDTSLCDDEKFGFGLDIPLLSHYSRFVVHPSALLHA